MNDMKGNWYSGSGMSLNQDEFNKKSLTREQLEALNRKRTHDKSLGQTLIKRMDDMDLMK